MSFQAACFSLRQNISLLPHNKTITTKRWTVNGRYVRLSMLQGFRRCFCESTWRTWSAAQSGSGRSLFQSATSTNDMHTWLWLANSCTLERSWSHLSFIFVDISRSPVSRLPRAESTGPIYNLLKICWPTTSHQRLKSSYIKLLTCLLDL